MQKDPHAVHVYVDGSFQGHQGRRAGYAGHVEFPDSPVEEEIAFEGFKESTNNRMELAAVVAALKWIRENRPTTTRAQIFSDSRYVIDNIPRAPYWCADKWRTAYGRPIENADLWDKFLAAWTRAGVRVDFGWVRGKSTPLLRKVDASAKAAAKSGIKVDRGYRPGKVGRSLKKGGAATMYLAAGQEAVIRIYWTKLAGASKESRVTFELFDSLTGEPRAKHYAYARPTLAAELHRHHVYRVQMNNQPKYPQILRIVEEIASPKKPVASRGQGAVVAIEPRDGRAAV